MQSSSHYIASTSANTLPYILYTIHTIYTLQTTLYVTHLSSTDHPNFATHTLDEELVMRYHKYAACEAIQSVCIHKKHKCSIQVYICLVGYICSITEQDIHLYTIKLWHILACIVRVVYMSRLVKVIIKTDDGYQTYLSRLEQHSCPIIYAQYTCRVVLYCKYSSI